MNNNARSIVFRLENLLVTYYFISRFHGSSDSTISNRCVHWGGTLLERVMIEYHCGLFGCVR